MILHLIYGRELITKKQKYKSTFVSINFSIPILIQELPPTSAYIPNEIIDINELKAQRKNLVHAEDIVEPVNESFAIEIDVDDNQENSVVEENKCFAGASDFMGRVCDLYEILLF